MVEGALNLYLQNKKPLINSSIRKKRPITQLVEFLSYKQAVIGSSPVGPMCYTNSRNANNWLHRPEGAHINELIYQMGVVGGLDQ